MEPPGSNNSATQQAHLAWSASSDPAAVALELRRSVGPEYNAEDASPHATFAPDVPGQWSGSFGLQVPGSAASW